MTQDIFAGQLSSARKLTGVSQHDFDLVRKIAPVAREWSDEVAQFFCNLRSLAGKQPVSKKMFKKHYLSFFDFANHGNTFSQEKAHFYNTLEQESKFNEFLIGFSAMLITAYGRKDGLKFSAAFERIMKARIALQLEGQSS